MEINMENSQNKGDYMADQKFGTIQYAIVWRLSSEILF